MGIKTLRSLRATSIPRDSGDYGSSFATYTPPAGFEGRVVLAHDTNDDAKRLYAYVGGAWTYAALT